MKYLSVVPRRQGGEGKWETMGTIPPVSVAMEEYEDEERAVDVGEVAEEVRVLCRWSSKLVLVQTAAHNDSMSGSLQKVQRFWTSFCLHDTTETKWDKVDRHSAIEELINKHLNLSCLVELLQQIQRSLYWFACAKIHYLEDRMDFNLLPPNAQAAIIRRPLKERTYYGKVSVRTSVNVLLSRP